LESLLWPRECVLCRTRLETGALCDDCRSKLDILPWLYCGSCNRRLVPKELCAYPGHRTPLRGLGVALRYDVAEVKEAIWAYKYRRHKDLAEEFAKILIRYAEHLLRDRLPSDSLVIPVPLHPKRERERGFNQAALIAKPFAEHFGYEYRDNILYRALNTQPQAKIENAVKRRENVTGVFSSRPAPELLGKTAIIIDDVSTTGATLEEAARTLRRAGCKNVWGLVIARGL